MLVKLNSGYEMPMFGLGVYKMTDESETIESIKHALKIGYRLIDTASFYGNEELVGKAIRESGLKREDIFVTTKVWNDDLRNDSVREATEKSLEKLGFDYVDLLLIHWPVKDKYVSAWKVFESMNKEKLAKSIGVSNFTVPQLEHLLSETSTVPAVNQIELHPYLSQEEIVSFCTLKGIVVTAWSPLAAKKNDLLNEKALLNIADKYGKTTAQVVLRWDLQRGISVIPKSSNLKRIEENFRIFDFELNDEDMDKINAMNIGMRTGPDPDNFDF